MRILHSSCAVLCARRNTRITVRKPNFDAANSDTITKITKSRCQCYSGGPSNFCHLIPVRGSVRWFGSVGRVQMYELRLS